MRRMQDAAEEDALGEGKVAAERESVEPNNNDVRDSGGKGRFYVESKPTQGYLLIKGARGSAKEMVERLAVNKFLKKAQKSAHFKEMIIEKVSHLLGLLLVEEDDRKAKRREHDQRAEQMAHLERVIQHMQQRLHAEEEAKRRTLLRYVHAIKDAADATEAAQRAGALEADPTNVGGVVQLAESGTCCCCCCCCLLLLLQLTRGLVSLTYTHHLPSPRLQRSAMRRCMHWLRCCATTRPSRS